MEKQYKDFDEMMTDLQGVTMDEAVKMKMTKGLKSLKGVDAGEGRFQRSLIYKS